MIKIKNLFYYFLMCLPTYIFFFILYTIIKRKSQDGTLKTYYFDIDKDNNYNFDNIDKLMNRIMPKLLSLIFSFAFSFYISSFIHEQVAGNLLKYLISAEALRLLKYMLEGLTTITLAVIGLIAVFSSLNKNYYIFFSTQEMFKSWKVKEKIESIAFYFVLTLLGVVSYYIYYYIFTSTEIIKILMITSFIFTLIASMALILNLYQLLKVILKFLLIDNCEFALLEKLHFRVYDTKRPYNEKLNINNFSSIESNLNYLLSKYTWNLNNNLNKIEYVFFPDEYKSLSKGKKIRNYLRSLACLLFGNFIIDIFACSMFHLEINIIAMIFITVILNIVVLTVIYKSDGFRDMFILINMDSFGFKIKQNNHIVYFSVFKKTFTQKHYNNYIKNLYNIVSLFRDVLKSNNKLVSRCYKKIIESENIDYLLYSVCTFLYYDKYKIKAKKYLWNLKQYINNHGIDMNLVENNTMAVITDIVRDYSIENKVKNFFYQVRKSHCK